MYRRKQESLRPLIVRLKDELNRIIQSEGTIDEELSRTRNDLIKEFQ